MALWKLSNDIFLLLVHSSCHPAVFWKNEMILNKNVAQVNKELLRKPKPIPQACQEVSVFSGIWLWKNSNAHACVWLSLKQISSTSSPYRPLPPWIKGRVSSTAAPVLLQAPPSFLAFEPSSVRLLPKLVGARTHQGHLSPALSSHRLVQACSIHNFCHFSSTMCIYMHICTQTLALPLVFLH